MATLNRNKTDWFYSCRTFTNESKTNGNTDGDFFVWIWSTGLLTTSAYNTMVDDYNDAEGFADNSNLLGTDPSNSTFPISSLPNRSRPIHK